MSKKYKVGQEVKAGNDFIIEGLLGNNSIQIKEGDTGIIDTRGFVHWKTGQASGKIQKMEDSEVKGFDTENISKLLLEEILYIIDEDCIDEYDKEEIKERIEDILMEILH